MIEVTPEIKAKSAKTAMLTSRINTLLSLTNVTFNGNGAKSYIKRIFLFIFF